MTQTTTPPEPTGLGFGKLLLSGAIGLHLAAVLVSVLNVPSGPWPTPEGGSMAYPPHFTQALSRVAVPYLQGTNLLRIYNFGKYRAEPECQLEIRLRDRTGGDLGLVLLPDPRANYFARQRQRLLAAALANDEPVVPVQGELVPAANQPVRSRRFWDAGEDRVGRIVTIEEHLLPRDRPLFGPSEPAMILARAYARHLCAERGAASAEIVRITRDYIPPDVLLAPVAPQSGAFDGSTSNFGVFHGLTQVQ